MNIKKELVVGAALALGIIVYVFSLSKGAAKTSPVVPNNVKGAEAKQAATLGFTSEQVAKHNTKEDCYLIINGNVYNVTSFIDQHPGGAERILFFCGQDATQAFMTRGDKGNHPDKAQKLLENFRIGSIKN